MNKPTEPMVPQFLIMKTIALLGSIKSVRGMTQADVEDVKQELAACIGKYQRALQGEQPERKAAAGEELPPTAGDKIRQAEIDARARHDESEKRISDAAAEGRNGSGG